MYRTASSSYVRGVYSNFEENKKIVCLTKRGVDMITKPLVSICIPTYKRYDQLKVCIENALGQDYDNIEVLVSDDTQDEPVPEWLQSLSNQESKLRYIKQPVTLGLIPNNTFVRENARGEYLCVMHNDDEFPRNYISKMMEILNSDGSCSLVGAACARYFEGSFWHDYETYSSLGMSQFERLRDFAIRAFNNPWSTEHLMYGVYKRDTLSHRYCFGYHRSIILFLYLCSIKGCIHSVQDMRIIKHTTRDDIKKYAAARYIKRNVLMMRILSRRQEERLTLLYRIISRTLLSKHIKSTDKGAIIFIALKTYLRNKSEFYYPF